VVPGKPDESLIYTLPAHLENPKMPPNAARLPQRELDLVFGWIQGGLSERVTVAEKSSTRPVRPVNLQPRPRPISGRPASPGPGNTVTPKTMEAADTPEPDQPTTNLPAVKIVPRQTHVVTALATSPTAALMAVSGQQQVLVYRWTDQSLVTAFPFPQGDVFTLRFSRDGQLLLAGGGEGAGSGRVALLDVSTGQQVFAADPAGDVVLAADLSPDGRLVACGGPSRVVRLIDTITGTQVAEMKKHTDWIMAIAFSPDGLLLASADRFGSIHVQEASTGADFCTLRGHTGSVNSLMWSADSDQLISCGQDGTVRFWDMHQATQQQLLNGDSGGILAADRDATGRLVLGGRDQRLTVWSADINQPRRLADLPDEVVELAITQDGTHVIAADASGSTRLFDLATGAPQGDFVLPEGGLP
jgi:WD40 repeat protein